MKDFKSFVNFQYLSIKFIKELNSGFLDFGSKSFNDLLDHVKFDCDSHSFFLSIGLYVNDYDFDFGTLKKIENCFNTIVGSKFSDSSFCLNLFVNVLSLEFEVYFDLPF